MNKIQHQFSNILLPINAQQLSEETLTYAASLGELCGASLTLLFVLDGRDHNAGSGLAAETTEQSAARIDQLMTDQIRPLLGNTPISQVITREGKPADEIIATANQIDADLVLMGTRGKTGLQHLIMGSITEKVVHLINRPVLTVPVK